MSCCGSRRAAWNRRTERRTIAAGQAGRGQRDVAPGAGVSSWLEDHGAAGAPEFGGVRLSFLGSVRMLLRGPVSGLEYSAEPAIQGLHVDPRDVDALLASGLFRRSTEPEGGEG